MSSIEETAAQFIEACDGGKGWEVCAAYCHADATFSAQAAALAEIETLESYTEWAKGLLGPIPDASFEVKSLGVDEARGHVCAYAVFAGTHSGEGGPVAPTGKAVATNYVYAMEFADGKIRHMTKIWNDGDALQQLGWG